MDKKHISITLIILCFTCLLIGIFNSSRTIYKTESYTSNTQGNVNKLMLSPTSKVALITIDGIIDSTNKSNAFSNEFNAQSALKSIKQAKEDENIKGVVIKINSPGGTVAMSQSIYNEIMRLRKTKPVVVSMEDVAASGGYYIAAAADRIVALDGTLTGSIGVIFSTLDMHQLLSEKLLVSPNVIKSGKYKDIGSAYRQMTTEDKTIIKGIVDDSYGQFLNSIKKGRINRTDKYTTPKRELKYDILKKYADGRVFTGEQAYKLGFVDKIGDLTDAQDCIKSMINEKYHIKAEVVLAPYNKATSFSEFLFGATESVFNHNSIIESFLPVSIKLSKKPLYLWE